MYQNPLTCTQCTTGEVDLEMDEDNSADEDAGDTDSIDQEGEDGAVSSDTDNQQHFHQYAHMEVMNEDSNSMDVERMLQQ